jgi:hypothetical protein
VWVRLRIGGFWIEIWNGFWIGLNFGMGHMCERGFNVRKNESGRKNESKQS